MKSILFIGLLITSSVFGQTIELTRVVDYDLGSGIESLNMISKSGSWINVYPSDFKIPQNLMDYELVHEIIDNDQVVYQSCNGEINIKNTTLINTFNKKTSTLLSI